jgi:hypothetical protein
MTREPEYVGAHFTIRCQELQNGACPVGEFLDGLPKSDRRKLDVLFEYLGEHGKITNPEKFKKVEDGIWEFKSFQIRILCFYAPGRQVMLCNWEIKKRDNLKESTVRTARDRKQEFFNTQL